MALHGLGDSGEPEAGLPTQHQTELRAGTYKNISEVLEARQLEVAPVTDAMHGDDDHTRIGKKVLSSTFIGGPTGTMPSSRMVWPSAVSGTSQSSSSR